MYILRRGGTTIVKQHGRIRFVLAVLAALVLAGCADTSTWTESSQQQSGFVMEDYLASLQQDDVGRYRPVGSSYVRGVETEFDVTLEARFYPELGQMRFAVVSQGLRSELQRAGGVHSLTLSTEGGPSVASNSLRSLTVADIEGGTQAATDLFSVNPYDATSGDELCGHFTMKFANENRMPIQLQVCNQVGPIP